MLLLVIFATLNSASTVATLGGAEMRYVDYYAPALMCIGIIGATFVNLAIVLCQRRENGQLKRVRGSPLPPWVFFAGIVVHAVLVAAVLATTVTAIAVVFYDVPLPRHWPTLAVAVAAGTATSCALGLATTSLVPNAEAAPAFVNLVFYPLAFISGTFFPVSPESVLGRVAEVFPVHHFIGAVQTAFHSPVESGGLFVRDVLILLVWGAAGAVGALTRFRWEPARR